VRYELRELGKGLAWFNFDSSEERLQRLEAQVEDLFGELEKIKASLRPETI
jgi:hypothetical protein